MIGFIIGAIVGSVIATNFNLIPFYEDQIKPTIDTGIDKIREYTQKEDPKE